MASKECNAEAEKAYKLAEERFLVGDIAGALRLAKRFSSYLTNALAAYEVHAAAVSRGKWYAVLGIGDLPANAITHDAIRKQYRRLCLVLHPDKNRSAAADGAFKLLQKAWEELSVRHPPGPASSAKAADGSSRPPPPQPDWWSSFFSGWAAGDSSRSTRPDWKSWQARYERTFGTKAAGGGSRPPPPPKPPRSSFDWKSWQAKYARTSGTVYCGHCDPEFVAEGVTHDKSGERCHSCGARFRPPRQSSSAEATAPAPGTDADTPRPGTDAEPPPPPQPSGEDEEMEEEVPPPPPSGEAPRHRNGRYFPCPGQCPRCGTLFASTMVSVGMWHLSCKACHGVAVVHVRNRDTAYTF